MSSNSTSFLLFSTPEKPHSDPIPTTGGGIFDQERRGNIHFFLSFVVDLTLLLVALIQVFIINTVVLL